MTPTAWFLISAIIVASTLGPAVLIWVARRASEQDQKTEHDDDPA